MGFNSGSKGLMAQTTRRPGFVHPCSVPL